MNNLLKVTIETMNVKPVLKIRVLYILLLIKFF